MTRLNDPVLTSATGTHPRMPASMTQVAPYPTDLVDLVRNRLHLRQPGWTAVIEEDLDRGQGSLGMTFIIYALVEDSRVPGRKTRIAHLFPVPPAAYNERSWRHWIFQRYLEVLAHEGAEMFEVDGRLPFAPLHGPGNDPYMVIEATVAEEHTDNQGRITKPTEWSTYRPETSQVRAERLHPKGWGER